MGGASKSIEQSQINNANQQTAIAQEQARNSDLDRAARDKAQAPAISLYTALTSGDPNKSMTAAAPLLAPISQAYQSSKDSIFNNIAPGAGRDAALAGLNIQKNAQTAGIFSSTTASAYDKLANLGSGLGAFSLQDIGASLNAFGGAGTGYNDVQKQKTADKASTLGFLGQAVGAGASVATGWKGCWIAEAIYGVDDSRTHTVRAWLNGPYRATFIGSLVMDVYWAIGRPVAWAVRRSSPLRALFKPLFDAALRKATEGR